MKESRYNIWVERGNAAYVFNGVSGALLRLPRKHYRALRAFLALKPASQCPPALVKQLAVGQMLIPDDADELGLLAKRYESSRYDSNHFALTIVTSLGCNFDCPYCFEAKHPSIMGKGVRQAILEALDDQLPRIKRFSVTWFGGEPLVGKKPLLELSDEFIKRCDQAKVGYSADLTTNGYLLDESTCAELKARRVQHAQVCLDGPPHIHDTMRPLVNGKGTFCRIVKNLHHAIDYLQITIRMNIDTQNFGHAEELLRVLTAEGFAGKVFVYAGQIVGISDGVPSPSATYRQGCFTNRQFAQAEREFDALATRYGFAKPSLPRPLGAPCTAVRANELVVGSEGELYKCWDSVGNSGEVVGNIQNYGKPNGRLQKWLKYNPFQDEECRGCIALPVCMGGCAHHAMDLLQHENRCSTFRHSYREQVLKFVESAENRSSSASAVSIPLLRQMEPR